MCALTLQEVLRQVEVLLEGPDLCYSRLSMDVELFARRARRSIMAKVRLLQVCQSAWHPALWSAACFAWFVSFASKLSALLQSSVFGGHVKFLSCGDGRCGRFSLTQAKCNCSSCACGHGRFGQKCVCQLCVQHPQLFFIVTLTHQSLLRSLRDTVCIWVSHMRSIPYCRAVITEPLYF